MATASIKVEIPDDGLAAWMTINNLTLSKSGTRPDFWSGVLFHVGRFTSFSDPSRPIDILEAIEVEGNSTVTISKGELRRGAWINVLADYPSGRRPPIDPQEKGELFRSSLHKYLECEGGGVVVWQASGQGFDLRAVPNVTGSNEYEFTFPKGNGSKAEIHDDKGGIQILENVTRVRFVATGGGGGSDVQNPPQRP